MSCAMVLLPEPDGPINPEVNLYSKDGFPAPPRRSVPIFRGRPEAKPTTFAWLYGGCIGQ